MPSPKFVPSVSHCDNGAVRFRGFLLDGEMHGAWEFFRKDGSPMRSAEFDRGQQIGIWRTFDRAGKIVKETDISKGD
ncbi:MAG: hypothetical protein ABI864_01030 [Chloroflexota bacterium]